MPLTPSEKNGSPQGVSSTAPAAELPIDQRDDGAARKSVQAGALAAPSSTASAAPQPDHLLNPVQNLTSTTPRSCPASVCPCRASRRQSDGGRRDNRSYSSPGGPPPSPCARRLCDRYPLCAR